MNDTHEIQRQAKILDKFLRGRASGKPVTYQDIGKSLGVTSHEMQRQRIEWFVELGYIEQIGEGKKARYVWKGIK